MMKRAFMMLLVALAALLMTTSRAAQVPVCPPDDIDQALDALGDASDEEKLAYLISVINGEMQQHDPYSRLFLDEKNNAVVMQMNAEDEGISPDDWDPDYADLFKTVFLKSFLDNEESLLFLAMIAATERDFVFQGVFPGKAVAPLTLTFTPEEIYDAVVECMAADYGDDSPEFAEEDDSELVSALEGMTGDNKIHFLTNLLNEAMQMDEDINAQVWIDEPSKTIVWSMVDEEFTDLDVDSEEDVQLIKMLLLGAVASEVGTELFEMIANEGYGLEFRLMGHEGQTVPLVLAFTAEELLSAVTYFEAPPSGD
ncbi:MAG: hypothetical protein J5503_04060 [Muribaculaceae bacterium]|nr:hypothetical protein [Muribaculaceae bacterium]